MRISPQSISSKLCIPYESQPTGLVGVEGIGALDGKTSAIIHIQEGQGSNQERSEKSEEGSEKSAEIGWVIG